MQRCEDGCPVWVPGSASGSGSESADEHIMSFCSFMTIRSVVLHDSNLPKHEKEGVKL